MTGWYPHTAGHRTLDNLLKPWEPNLLKYLKDAGYEVSLAGNRGDVFAQARASRLHREGRGFESLSAHISNC